MHNFFKRNIRSRKVLHTGEFVRQLIEICRTIFFEQATSTNMEVLKKAPGLLEDPLYAQLNGIIPVAKIDSLA